MRTSAALIVSLGLSCAVQEPGAGWDAPSSEARKAVKPSAPDEPPVASRPTAAVAQPSFPTAAAVQPVVHAASTPCPQEMVQLGRLCIDRYEAHLRPITPSGVGPAYPHYRRPVSGARYRAVSQPGVFPQGYISRVEAEAACVEAGKRLCSRGEWMLACRGTPSAPKGRARSRSCNHGKIHLLTKMFGGDYDYERSFNSPKLNQTPGFLALTGDYAECSSAAGVHDMVGNLHEWVSDTVTSSFLRAIDAEGVRRQFQYRQPGNAVFMGGFYSTKGELGPGCLFTTVAHDAGYHDYSTGFRCCRGVEGL